MGTGFDLACTPNMATPAVPPAAAGDPCKPSGGDAPQDEELGVVGETVVVLR